MVETRAAEAAGTRPVHPDAARSGAITELTAAELDELLAGQPAYRRDQLRRAVYQSTARGFAQITTLPQRLREELAARVAFTSLTEQDSRRSQDGTRKTRFQTADGAVLEAVRMPSERGPATTVCLSSQAGCALGCTFCATGALGLTRNLTAGEIVDQFLYFRRTSGPRRAPNRVVFMGMGEPLANLPQVRLAVEALVDPARVGLGARRVTVSTVGLPDGIEEIARWSWSVGLAISLHAPNDELRAELVPLARKVSLVELMQASLAYQRLTGRRVTYEYTLLAGVNDSPALARRLAKLLSDHRCHVNLIPFNRYPGAKFRTTGAAAALAFRNVLRRGGVPATVRRTRGRDVSAACGQLHAETLSADNSPPAQQPAGSEHPSPRRRDTSIPSP